MWVYILHAVGILCKDRILFCTFIHMQYIYIILDCMYPYIIDMHVLYM